MATIMIMSVEFMDIQEQQQLPWQQKQTQHGCFLVSDQRSNDLMQFWRIWRTVISLVFMEVNRFIKLFQK